MKNIKSINYIDILKLFFAICIVALHTSLFLDVNYNLYWYLSHCIWRLAVPFFFITSGYFYVKKIRESTNPKKVLVNYNIRLFVLLVFWLLINSPFKIKQLLSQGFFGQNLILRFVQELFFYPWGALWYIWALIISSILIYPFVKKQKYNLPLIIGFILYIFALFTNSYYFLIEDTFLQKIVDIYMKIFISARNGIFVGFFYLAISNYLYYKKNKNKNKNTIQKNIIMIFIGLIFLLIETIFIKNRHYIDDHSLFLSLIIIVPNIVELGCNYLRKDSNKIIRNLSIGIYVLHRPIISLLDSFILIELSIIKFVVVLLISITISIILQKLNNKYINKIIT